MTDTMLDQAQRLVDRLPPHDQVRLLAYLARAGDAPALRVRKALRQGGSHTVTPPRHQCSPGAAIKAVARGGHLGAQGRVPSPEASLRAARAGEE